MNIKTPAVITSIRSKVDKSLGLSIETPELSNAEKVEFMNLQGINISLTITPTDTNEQETIEVTSEAEPKSRSQKLRSVLYVLFKQKYAEKYPTFTDFYNSKMDTWIDNIKETLV
jgi:hypothetical protein